MKSLLAIMIESNCGILTKDAALNRNPPNQLHYEACCQEIERIAILISSKSFTTDLDIFLAKLIEKALHLDSRNRIIDALSSNAFTDSAMSKYWDGIPLSPHPQIEDYRTHCRFPFELSTVITADKTDETWCLAPSTRLLKSCCHMLKQCATLAMQKKPKWVRFIRAVDALIANLQKEEVTESKPVEDFAAAFSITSKLNQKEDDSIIPYFRESSCLIILSCLLAREYSTSSALHVNIGLNKSTREKVSLMCKYPLHVCSSHIIT